eukprot:3628792-Prymnesium_polylepis.1
MHARHRALKPRALTAHPKAVRPPHGLAVWRLQLVTHVRSRGRAVSLAREIWIRPTHTRTARSLQLASLCRPQGQSTLKTYVNGKLCSKISLKSRCAPRRVALALRRRGSTQPSPTSAYPAPRRARRPSPIPSLAPLAPHMRSAQQKLEMQRIEAARKGNKRAREAPGADTKADGDVADPV